MLLLNTHVHRWFGELYGTSCTLYSQRVRIQPSSICLIHLPCIITLADARSVTKWISWDPADQPSRLILTLLLVPLNAEVKLVAAKWKLVGHVVQNVGQAWQMHQIGCHLSAQHLWAREERAIAQVCAACIRTRQLPGLPLLSYSPLVKLWLATLVCFGAILIA